MKAKREFSKKIIWKMCLLSTYIIVYSFKVDLDKEMY